MSDDPRSPQDESTDDAAAPVTPEVEAVDDEGSDWEAHAAAVTPSAVHGGDVDDDADLDDTVGDETSSPTTVSGIPVDQLDLDDPNRVAAWLASRASAAGGRFRQTAAELRQSLAGEASARQAFETLRERRRVAAALAEARTPEQRAVDKLLDVDDAPPIPVDLTAAAFFDVDNTLVQGASIVHFARGLAARKYFSYGDIMQFAWSQAKFRITGRENADDVAEGREKALSFIAGRETSELVELGEEIYDEFIADKLWAGTRALTQKHLDAGQQVWLVTATPVELAQTIATRLGLTGALGTVAESVDGVFTGRLVGDILHGPGKAHAVRSLAIREGLNLKRCTAYSDSHNDVPMLSLVGTAVAINPDSDLKDVAKVRGWEIYDFRTARKAAKYSLRTAIVLGAAGAATSGAVATVRHFRK
ncbi:HAD-IB family hydrolase [Gordonia sp. TBRC 11910]|uniref:HAD-IB family hydrolase n=1 Tax=Gordonia asplenii TaxID=2725283 RepID=A0A848L8J4_9ACTN|nr:HAD-IB family hydrolase [Gordonia asplenii]NMO03898.1 HAD-IB family hydrolase [Gordonia asplenii]